MASPPDVDLVRMTATELQTLLQDGKLSSVDLVKACLAQINRYNGHLRAVTFVAPEALVLEQAARSDRERAEGKVRGPLHGIPVLLKDAIRTNSDLGMPTAVGNLGLVEAQSNRSARVVDQIQKKGLIILDKTNLNELASWKSMGPMNGWSAAGGQTISAYVNGDVDWTEGVMGHTNPCGASTGSAVGVSAGFSPVSVGTEVEGSLVQPAARAGLYGIKPTIGITELEGVFAVDPAFESLGVMAKSAIDLAHMTEMILTEESRKTLPVNGYLGFMRTDFHGMRVGFVDPQEWRWPDAVQKQVGNTAKQMQLGYLAVLDKFKAYGGHAEYPVDLPPVSDLMLNGQPATILAIRHVFKKNVDDFLSAYSVSDIRTAEELMAYNKKHADKELPPAFPEQDRLVDTLKNPISSEQRLQAMAHCRKIARDRGIDATLTKHELDLIVFPLDSPCARVAAAAGYPIATVPVDVLEYNGRPFGLGIIAMAGREDLIFSFMSAFETVWKPRPIPLSMTL